jgi:Flp pilus assembly protein TadB
MAAVFLWEISLGPRGGQVAVYAFELMRRLSAGIVLVRWFVLQFGTARSRSAWAASLVVRLALVRRSKRAGVRLPRAFAH